MIEGRSLAQSKITEIIPRGGAMERWPKIVVAAVLALGMARAAPLSAQDTGPGLVVPVPDASRITIASGTYRSPSGASLAFEVFRSAAAGGVTSLVVFANGIGPALPRMRGYRDWASLVTTRGFAAVLYDGPTFDPSRPLRDNLRESVAHLDSVIAVLRRRGAGLGVDPTALVVWAGSAQTATGTPYALSGERTVKGYVLYYGAGEVAEPRVDVPVLAVRAGLDSPGLNASFDSLTRQLIRAGAPVTVVNYPAGSHGFDVLDSTAMTGQVIDQTLEFMVAVTKPSLHAAIDAGVPEVEAAAAFAAERWDLAEALYTELGRHRPESRSAAWRLGLAQLAAGHPLAALASFDRAKTLGQGGARDIGLPATRAAIRAGRMDRAVEWVLWALQRFPRIRDEIAADSELAPLLADPKVKAG